MDVAVVYESMFGMTHDVAEAVAEGVSKAQADARVVCLRVGEATPDRVGTPDLLIVGGPTHMRGMSSGMSRKIAVSIEEKAARGKGEHQGHGLEPAVEGPGLRQWFHGLPKAAKGQLRRGVRHAGGLRVHGGWGGARYRAPAPATRLPYGGRSGGLHHRGRRRSVARWGAGTRERVGGGARPTCRGPGCHVEVNRPGSRGVKRPALVETSLPVNPTYCWIEASQRPRRCPMTRSIVPDRSSRQISRFSATDIRPAMTAASLVIRRLRWVDELRPFGRVIELPVVGPYHQQG